MTTSLAQLDIDGRTARLTLNRPDKRNALSLDLLAAIDAQLDALASRADVSVCTITGAGPVFCAGMDLRAVLDVPGAPPKLLSAIAELTIKLRNLPAVTVAKVNGAAIGGGCGIVAVCDIAITHESARLGYPEVDLGVCPAVVAPWLVSAIGAGRARRVLLSGGTMRGTEAQAIGLVAHCVADGRLDEATGEIVARLAGAGPHALRATKALLNEHERRHIEAAVREGARISAEVIESPEARASLAERFAS